MVKTTRFHFLTLQSEQARTHAMRCDAMRCDARTDLDNDGAVGEEAEGEVVESWHGGGDAARFLAPHEQLGVIVRRLRLPRDPVALRQVAARGRRKGTEKNK